MTIAIGSLSLTALPAEDEALRDSVRAFLRQSAGHLPPEVRARSWTGYDSGFSRELGHRGLIGIALPTEYGGGGRTAFARYVLVEELLNHGAPVGAHWISERQSAPLILKYGTQDQKRFYIPPVCRGESYFCVGMSEPNAGSDLANVRTRVSRNSQGWVLNGQKIWTTNAHRCHYMVALVRTSGTSDDRHLGLSQVIVDLSLPGVRIRPIVDLTGDSHFCEVFFEDVQLMSDAVLGTEGDGWNQVMSELAFERSGPERIFSSIVLFDEWLAYIRTSVGHCPESVRLAGKMLCHIAPLRAMSISVTRKLAAGESPATEAALVKDLGTAIEQAIPALIADDLFRRPAHNVPLELLRTLDYTTQVAPSFSLRGGTRDILRSMIARGLGLR